MCENTWPNEVCKCKFYQLYRQVIAFKMYVYSCFWVCKQASPSQTCNTSCISEDQYINPVKLKAKESQKRMFNFSATYIMSAVGILRGTVFYRDKSHLLLVLKKNFWNFCFFPVWDSANSKWLRKCTFSSHAEFFPLFDNNFCFNSNIQIQYMAPRNWETDLGIEF